MCGINGIVYSDRHRTPDRSLIEAMNRALAHRGPNDDGIWIHGPAALGSRRLSIIDRTGGHQPLCNEDGTVWITFNGEIYNYADLRRDLIARGHVFKTCTDTEVIVHLYEERRERCVDALQGMFAFAIWDTKTQTLLLARDRLGIKHLYYHQAPDFLAFSSEIKALLTMGTIPRRLNPQALHDYLTFQSTAAPETMFEGIEKLEPGHIVLVHGSNLTKKRYWALDYSRKIAQPEEACIEEFSERFRAVTKSHLVGEVPLGVLLSGGLDSAAVAAHVSELASKRLKTFSVGFADGGDAYDERRYARLVARQYDTDHSEIAITHKDFVDGLRDYIWWMEEPMADASSVPLYYVSKLASEHVTVVLSGEGSDELFGGYFDRSEFRGLARARWARHIPALVRRGILRPFNDSLLKSRRIRRYLDLADRPVTHYFQVVPLYKMGNAFSEDAKRELYGPGMLGIDGLRPSADLLVDAYRRVAHFDFLDQVLAVFTQLWLSDDLLLKDDKMTMAHSLELRVPFLDHTFVEFVASLPVNLKLRNGREGLVTKYALRRSCEGRLPAEILNRRKLGFPVPVAKLFQHDLKPLARDVFASRLVKESGVFNPARLLAALDRDEANPNHWGRLWRVLVFCLWQDVFKVAIDEHALGKRPAA